MVKQTIKIYGRVKPTKKSVCIYEVEQEPDANDRISFSIPKDYSGGYVNNVKEAVSFQFDKLFDQDSKQEEIFENLARPVADNALAGYNGTIFAYGQTGSGKTFTMTGGAERYADRGIIPRTLEYLFQQYEAQPHLQFTTQVSYLEIYNQAGYDLLDPNKEIKKMEDLPKVSLMEDNDSNVHLKNLSLHNAASEEDALNLLFIGDTNRMIAETPMNQASTRSHCIFTIHISSRESHSAVIRRAKLHLVDLAGSERVGKTGVTGSLLTEAKFINVSLHYLEQVIVALSEKSRSHIPYRNSMMTSVLRDSLGGNCMTTMIATISVENRNLDESISTCRFAQRVALIKNDVSVNEELDPRLMVVKLKKEVADLKTQLSMSDNPSSGEPLSDEDLSFWKSKCKAFIQDKDPESSLDTGPDIRKIKACFNFLKYFCNEAQKIEAKSEGSAPQTIVNHVAVPTSAYDTKEVKDLKELLRQRDNEINILVNMLKKEKQRNNTGAIFSSSNSSSEGKGADASNGHPRSSESASNAQRVTSSAVAENSPNVTRASDQSVNPRDSISSSGSQRMPNYQSAHKTAVDSIVQKKIGDMSMGRQEAFEIFKRDYSNRELIEEKKSQLKQCYAIAKEKGQLVNSCRIKINECKGAIQQLRVSAAMSSDGDQAADNEQLLRKTMEDEKTKYKNLFEELKQVKSQIEHLQHLLERDKVQILKDFDSWWSKQEAASEESRGVSGDFSRQSTDAASAYSAHHLSYGARGSVDTGARVPLSPENSIVQSNPPSETSNPDGGPAFQRPGSSSSTRTSGSAKNSDVVPANIPMTGDAKTDADIISFFKARQKALGNAK